MCRLLVVRKSVPSRTEIPSVREPGTNGNHAPIGQAQNDGYSTNSQEIPVSMKNERQEGTEDQSITSADGEYLRHMTQYYALNISGPGS